MKSRATLRFWKLYDHLPVNVQRQARKACETWKANPNHPSLHFKRVDDVEPVYSVRVSEDYRVLGLLDGETFV